MALNGINRNVTPSRLLGGAKNAQGIKKVATEVAETAGPVVQDGLGSSVQTSMASNIQKLKLQLSSAEGLSGSGINTALMAAGAILSGPSGVVPHTLAGQLDTAMSSKQGREELASSAAKVAKSGSQMENAQLNHMGIEVTGALTKEGVQGKNVPTALFMSGAIAHHQSGI